MGTMNCQKNHNAQFLAEVPTKPFVSVLVVGAKMYNLDAGKCHADGHAVVAKQLVELRRMAGNAQSPCYVGFLDPFLPLSLSSMEST